MILFLHSALKKAQHDNIKIIKRPPSYGEKAQVWVCKTKTTLLKSNCIKQHFKFLCMHFLQLFSRCFNATVTFKAASEMFYWLQDRLTYLSIEVQNSVGSLNVIPVLKSLKVWQSFSWCICNDLIACYLTSLPISPWRPVSPGTPCGPGGPRNKHLILV